MHTSFGFICMLEIFHAFVVIYLLFVAPVKQCRHIGIIRLTPVLATIFHQCVIPYTCSQSNSDGSVTEPSELDWLQVYGMTH